MRKNRGGKIDFEVNPNVELNEADLSRGGDAFEDWHWGVRPHKVVDYDDDDYPEVLIECGRLIRLHIRTPWHLKNSSSRHPRRQRDTMIELSRHASLDSHIAFDPDHKSQRLYLIVNPFARQALKKRFWDENSLDPAPLHYVASLAGGRHGKDRDYPEIEVKPCGVCTAVVYYTHKKGDENPGDPRSYYIHQMGELTKYFPILCCDDQGRLWLAGGNYTSPTPGITD